MQRIEFPYGRTTAVLMLDGTENVRILGSRSSTQTDDYAKDQRSIVKEAIRNQIGGPSLKDLTKKARKICLITNDNTRPMPSRITIPAIIEGFYYPERYYDITILVATGLHRSMTEEEKREQFGEEVCRRYRIVCHDAEDPDGNVRVGTLPSGNELYIDRIAAESDLIISEGFIEPHFFAGFSGGRKSILPGIAGIGTIMRNHSPENVGHENAGQALLQGNPVHEECQIAAKIAGLAFIVNVTLGADKRITAAFAGDPELAFIRGTEYVRRKMTVAAEISDIVITSNTGYPLDRNFYQAVKGVDTAAKIVREGGVIIIASECVDGIGHESFREVMTGCASIEELYDKVFASPGRRDQWQAQLLMRARKKARIILVSDRISENELESMFIERASDLNAALQMAYGSVGKDPLITLLPEGPCIIPEITDNSH